MLAHDVIIKPIITEKTMGGMPNKKYTFKVAKDAKKITIAKEIEEIFKVEVQKVNTLNVRGRMKRKGKFHGYTSSWKKAYVTLKPNSKAIEFFEGIV